MYLHFEDWTDPTLLQKIEDEGMAQKLPIRGRLIYLDVFFPDSLKDLKRIVNYDDEAALVGKMDWVRWLRKDPTLNRPSSQA